VRGVVRDFQASGPKAKVNDFIYYAIRGGMFSSSFLYARGLQTPPTGEEIRAAAVRVDPRLAIYFPKTVQQVIETELSSVRLTTRLTLAYALAAVLLCAVGVYSITVSQIWQLKREFGIRMALGIDPARLWSHFARGTCWESRRPSQWDWSRLQGGARAAGTSVRRQRADPLTYAIAAVSSCSSLCWPVFRVISSLDGSIPPTACVVYKEGGSWSRATNANHFRSELPSSPMRGRGGCAVI